jgi:hypothetical protein
MRHRKPASWPARQHTRHSFPVHTYVHSAYKGVCISSFPGESMSLLSRCYCTSDPHGEHVPTRTTTVSLSLYRTCLQAKVRIHTRPSIPSPSTCRPTHALTAISPRQTQDSRARDSTRREIRQQQPRAHDVPARTLFLPHLLSLSPPSTSPRDHTDWLSSLQPGAERLDLKFQTLLERPTDGTLPPTPPSA